MTTRPSAELRRQVEERAHRCCEYCLVPQELAASRHQVDHVIAEKHGGQTTLDNLALSCTVCNRRKGSDIGSLDLDSGTLISLFNPRTQPWSDHFQLDGMHIIGLTAAGRTTVTFLQLNAVERLAERAAWIRAGRYPPG
jgi:HNH endonuclease